MYGALYTDQKSRPFQILYHNDIQPSILASPPPLFRDYVKSLLISQSTLSSQNIPPFKHLYEALPESTLPLIIYPSFKHIKSCDATRIYPSVPEYNRHLNKATLPTPSSQLCVTLP